MKNTTPATIPMHPTALFEAVFNHSPVGNYLLSPTPEATILAVNDAFLKASGCRREDLVGISLFVAFPSNPDDPFDSGESALRSSLARVAATGRPDTLPAQRYPIRVQLPNGGIVFEERFWDAVSTPIFGADGSLLCISHTTSDVTERVRAVTAIRESEARFRALTHASADVIYRMSPDWTELRQLQGRGFLKDNAGPRPYWLDDYVSVEDRDKVHAAIAEAIRNKSVFELEHRVRRVDGSQGWTLSRAVPMFGEDGEIEEWIGAASDITERKTAEEKLRESDRRKDEGLVRNTSQIIGRQVRHMTALINDLLDVSRVTRGLVELDKTTLDIARIADDAVEQVLPLIQSRGQQLGLVLPDEPALVCGDKKRLVQVLANLLNNAAKYTQEDGQLRVEVQADAAWIRIAVLDNGIGMAPELAARAFDLFTQADRSVDRSAGGLGLGLALVRQLVELHGGTVSCDSPGLGHGSRFTVELPRLAAQVLPAPQDADAGLAGPRPLRILVVDDNEDAADTLAMLLETSGHEVLVEHGSQAALERALAEDRKARPRSACSTSACPTWMAPSWRGACAPGRKRRTPYWWPLPATARKATARTRDAGFDHHLVKPIDLDQLHAVLGERTQAASTATGMRIR